MRGAFLSVQRKRWETVNRDQGMARRKRGHVFLPILTMAARAFESAPMGQPAAHGFHHLHFCSAYRTI
jgi:hypothetical protein